MTITPLQAIELYPLLNLQFPPHVEDEQSEIITRLLIQYQIPQDYAQYLQILLDKGVLGPQAQKEGWDNIGEHCIFAFRMGQVLCELSEMGPQETEDLCSEILLHDADIRNRKELPENNMSCSNTPEGLQFMNTTQTYYMTEEKSHEGIAHVTSMDWLGWESWTLAEQVMRYVDSCVGPLTRQSRDVIMHWSIRIWNLALSKQEMDQEYGQMLYPEYLFQNDGEEPRPSAFAYLMEVVMPGIEQSLFDAIGKANPSIVLDRQATDLFDIICKKLKLKFANFVEKS